MKRTRNDDTYNNVQHKKTHNDPENKDKEKIYRCPYCVHVSVTPFNMTTHIKTHQVKQD